MTGLFRDKPAWDYLARDVSPQIVAGKAPDEPTRVWSAGCASGEEAYTVAILLAEALGVDAFRSRVKIYATDVDEEALNQARQGSYLAKQLDEMPEAFRDSYFEQVNGCFVVRKDLRRSIIFGRNDLVQDAPISRIDLLICRNTLMYFNAEAQLRILAHFHFAMLDGAYLFLGKGEMLLTHGDLFAPVNLRRRVFAKVRRTLPRERLALLAQGAPDPSSGDVGAGDGSALLAQAFAAAATAEIVVDARGRLVLVNDAARTLLGLGVRDIGQPLQDLELSYRPLELRGPIEQAHAERRLVTTRSAEWRAADGTVRSLDVQVMPLFDDRSRPLGASVTYLDMTRERRLADDLQHSRQDLETAYEELQSTIEELETTNEELQSTNEELETTNEELQSTNEELETMNEELQSANEELETMNDELRVRGEDLNRTNAYLESILVALKVGVAVVGPDYKVQLWNAEATELWGLRADEVRGQHFLSLDIGLPVEQLSRSLRAVLSGETGTFQTVLDAVNRRGRSIHCEVSATPLLIADGHVQGAIILMEEERPVEESGS
ncbi:MAG TPA: CheR family methyltransferase [Thermomicrobiaceae bacterium]|nr:CheR family methyltransferase [Thermomicrobiaceae bacterium]